MFNKLISKLNLLLKIQSESGVRLRRVFINGLGAFGSRAVTMLVSIISLPLSIRYLGTERFGMMETMLSLVAIMNFADLGLGFGLQNRVAELHNTSDKNQLHRATSSVFSVLVIMSGFIAIVFVTCYSSINWESVFNIKSDLARKEVSPSILIFFICFIVQIPFSIVQKIQVGFQEGYKTELWRSLGNIFGLLCLLYTIYHSLGVPFIILSIYGSNTLWLIFNFIYEFAIVKKVHLPNPLKFDKQIFSKLYKDGAVFFILQMAYISLISSDRIIISHLLGPSAVAIYGVGFRLATLFSTPVDAFTLPLLPAFNDALAKNDIAWIKNILEKGFNYIYVISGSLSVILLLMGNLIIRYWIGGEIQLSLGVLVSFGFFIVFTNINSLLSYTMLTPKFIKNILYPYCLAVCVAIGLKFPFVHFWGVQGVVWATIISSGSIYFLYSYRQLKKVGFV